MWIAQIAAGSLLGIMSIRDIKTKQIPVLWLLPGVGITIGSYFLMPGITFEQRGMGFVLGGIMLGISWITRQAIGAADSSLILILGTAFGGTFCIQVALLAFFLAAVLGMILLITHHANRKSRMPFLPFLTGAFVIVSIFLR